MRQVTQPVQRAFRAAWRDATLDLHCPLLLWRHAMPGADPQEHSFIVVISAHHAMLAWRAEPALGAVQFARYDQLIDWDDRRLSRHHARQLVTRYFRLGQGHMAAQRHADGRFMVAQPVLDAVGLSGADGWHSGIPALADAVDVGDEPA